MGNIGFPTDDVPNQGWKLYITSLVMVLAAGVTVIARIATRYKFHNLGWDDFAIVLSVCFSIFLSIAIQTAVVEGYGRHIDDLDIPERRSALKWFWIAQTPYKIVVALNKTSLVLLYMRIFVSRSFKISAYVVMGVVVAYGIASVAATIFQCVPIPASWDKSIDGQCINSDEFWVANAILNVLTDVMVLALPIPSIIGLHLPWRQRLILCLIFLMGGFVTITSILRVTAVQNSLANRKDLTWNFITRGIWTLVEANLGIIGACLPIFKQPLQYLFPRIFSTNKSSSPSSSHGNRYGFHYGTGGSHHRNHGRPIQLSDTSPPQSHAMAAATSWKTSNASDPQEKRLPPRQSDELHIMSSKAFSTKGSDYGSDSV